MEIAQLEHKNGGILKNLNLFWPPKLTPTTLRVLEEESNMMKMEEKTLNEETEGFVMYNEKKIVLKKEEVVDDDFFEFLGEDECFYISQKIKFKIKDY